MFSKPLFDNIDKITFAILLTDEKYTIYKHQYFKILSKFKINCNDIKNNADINYWTTCFKDSDNEELSKWIKYYKEFNNNDLPITEYREDPITLYATQNNISLELYDVFSDTSSESFIDFNSLEHHNSEHHNSLKESDEHDYNNGLNNNSDSE